MPKILTIESESDKETKHAMLTIMAGLAAIVGLAIWGLVVIVKHLIH